MPCTPREAIELLWRAAQWMHMPVIGAVNQVDAFVVAGEATSEPAFERWAYLSRPKDPPLSWVPENRPRRCVCVRGPKAKRPPGPCLCPCHR